MWCISENEKLSKGGVGELKIKTKFKKKERERKKKYRVDESACSLLAHAQFPTLSITSLCSKQR